MNTVQQYGISKVTSLSYESAVQKIRQELRKEGFGVLTTIDMRETLKQKMNVDIPHYIILGACNPPFAYKALQADGDIGLLLPCNVVVREEKGKTIVSAFDPMAIMTLTQNKKLEEIAREVKQRLERVIQSI